MRGAQVRVRCCPVNHLAHRNPPRRRRRAERMETNEYYAEIMINDVLLRRLRADGQRKIKALKYHIKSWIERTAYPASLS
jgi:hypothetical protein